MSRPRFPLLSAVLCVEIVNEILHQYDLEEVTLNYYTKAQIFPHIFRPLTTVSKLYVSIMGMIDLKVIDGGIAIRLLLVFQLASRWKHCQEI